MSINQHSPGTGYEYHFGTPEFFTGWDRHGGASDIRWLTIKRAIRRRIPCKMKITPDIENEIRVVHLVNLQGTYADMCHDITIDELRGVMGTLWPEMPERFELLPDAHCKVVDHAEEVRAYYVNAGMWVQLLKVYSFLEALSDDLFDKPYNLMAVLGQLGVALEPKAARARRTEQIRKTVTVSPETCEP